MKKEKLKKNPQVTKKTFCVRIAECKYTVGLPVNEQTPQGTFNE